MQQGQQANGTVRDDEKVIAERDVLKIEEFVKKVGGIDKAKLALDELARLKKPA